MRIRSALGVTSVLGGALFLAGCGSDEHGGNSGSAGGVPGAGGMVSHATGGAGPSGGVTGSGAAGGTAGVGGTGGTGGAGGSSQPAGASGTGGLNAAGGASGRDGTSGHAGGAAAAGATSSGGSAAGGSAGLAGAGGGGQAGAGGSMPLTCASPAPTGTAYAVDTHGVTFTLTGGKMRVEVCKEDIIRVEYTSASAIPDKTSLSVNAMWAATPFCVTEASGTLTIATARIKAKVDESTGIVSYTDASDHALVAETSKSTAAATVEGVATKTIKTAFSSSADEALFGLGQHQDSVLNRKGTKRQLLNSNTEIDIPLLVSNKGYGILWDNYSTSNFDGTGSTSYSYSSEAGDMVDYYFFYGPSIDQVVALYRVTTGAPPLFPKWAYGLFQSKDHYGSTKELIAVKDGYRNAKIPVDVIVQDWDYWDPNSWGSHYMDSSRYADPASLVTTMHDANIHLMISIWPLYQSMSNPPTAGDQDNYNALNAIGALIPSGGSHHFYDTFSAAARTLVYQQIHDRLIAKYGWDAIWADNTEPQAYPDSINPNGNGLRGFTTALGKGALYINAYPLQHNKGLYEGWRSVGPTNKRVYVLTRSAFAGQQRYAAGVWSGDINAEWGVYTAQVPAGLSYAASGMPYWTTDIGGYFGTPTEELFTRWFQFGAFCSTFRIHGQATKELYGSQWSATGKANLLAIDRLHYRLMPYIYSLAWKMTNEGYTLMRPLVFDFQSDAMALGIKDQFMYGPAFLVSPVTTQGATSRSVYLPAGTWYDFWTGSTTSGGSKVTASAPLSQIPLYIKAGSIVPMGPDIQYATQSADPLELRIYGGGDATFTLYEDEGDGYAYETGAHAEITFNWSEAAKTLSIGARTGTYTGVIAKRTFNVVWVGASHGSGIDATATADKVVSYDGSAIVVNAP